MGILLKTISTLHALLTAIVPEILQLRGPFEKLNIFRYLHLIQTGLCRPFQRVYYKRYKDLLHDGLSFKENQNYKKGEDRKEPPGCETQGLPAADVLKVGPNSWRQSPQIGMPLCGGGSY